MLAPALPVRALARALPVPLMAAVPVSIRFSIAPRAGQREGDRGLDRVGAVAAGLVDDVAHIVDNVGVVAEAAQHRVGA